MRETGGNPKAAALSHGQVRSISPIQIASSVQFANGIFISFFWSMVVMLILVSVD